MRNLRWTGLTIALVAAALATGCGVEVYDSPGYPGPHSGARGRSEDRHSGDVEGTVLRVGRRDHVIVLYPGGEDRGERRDRGDEIVLFYDDSTTVEYNGRDYRPEDLERGDRIQATVDSRGDRQIAEDIHVTYDASEGREGVAPDPPGRPEREDSAIPDDQNPQGAMTALRGSIRSVDASGHSLEIETAGPAGDGSEDRDADGPSGVVVVRVDARTTVQFQGRSYRPENLDEGDVVEIRLRPSRDGRLMADQILVTGEGGPRPSRLIGSAQMPSTRLPMISSKPAITSDQNPRLPEPLGR